MHSSFKATGALFHSRFGSSEVSAIQSSDLVIKREPLLQGWEFIHIRAPTSWFENFGDAQPSMDVGYLLRLSGINRFLLLSTEAKFVEKLFTHLGIRGVTSPYIRINDLADDMVAAPKEYVLSTVYARVEGYGHALQSIALWGTDIGESKLFRELLATISPYRVTLRDARSQTNVLSISKRGSVDFDYDGSPESLKKVDECMRHLSARQYLDWDEH